MKRYNPSEIEPKWQKIWDDNKTYQAKEDPTRPKAYATPMLPYPSGAGLHVGHVRNYSIADAVARFERQKGNNTLFAIGWDSFGLPAENYAIKTGTPPSESTATNIANFKKQLARLGMSIDWSREVNTSDPEYYRWTQWIFAKLYEKGLAYQAESMQWWCNECKTVLANEQVVNGCCWRHEELLVVKKYLKQWFFKITQYADVLLEETDALDWPESIKAMQKNWIGKSKGAEVDFALENSEQKIRVFTTRPDTLYGATFLVLAPEHPLLNDLVTADQKEKVSEYISSTNQKSNIERMETNRDKTGVFSGRYAVNPVNNEKIPIWVADYVLMGYGTGAIMAVPAHDERDGEFARVHNLPVVTVIQSEEGQPLLDEEGLLVNSDGFDGLSSEQARERIVNELVARGMASETTNYKMRDWLISRQRYWGAPIPVIHCADHGAVVVPEKDLPVVLPEVKNFAPTGEATSVLALEEEWVNVPCPTCGKAAKRETDTMDGYACSSWYILRYCDPHNSKKAWDPEKVNYWMPMDYYFGGDHAVSHLLYFRFWMHFFADEGLIKKEAAEPVKKLVYNGYINGEDGNKMSKSKGNVVDPLEVINEGYGADALRIFELFIGPFDQDASWSTAGLGGAYRFIQRVWTLTQEYLEASQLDGPSNRAILVATNKAIKKVSKDLENLSFNTAVAAMMEFVNELYKIKAEDNYAASDWRYALECLVQIMAPFAPHVAEEMWQQLGYEESIHQDHWPLWDEQYLVADEITVVVQVNGKLRGEVRVPAGADQDTVLKAITEDKKISGYLTGDPKKVVYVPGRLINFVI